MVKITLIRTNEHDEFTFEGHANAGKKGTDIVCAAVSSMVEYLGFISSKVNQEIGKPLEPGIEEGASYVVFNRPDVNIIDGKADIKTNEDIKHYGYYVSNCVVVASAIDFFGRLSQQYPKNVEFKIYKAKNIEPDTKDVA